MEQVQFNDRLDRLIFGGIIIGGNVAGLIALSFVPIPPENATVFGQIVGGLSASVGVIAAATWKTSGSERQQAQTIQTLAAGANAPLTTTTTTTVEKGISDGQATGGSDAKAGGAVVGGAASGGTDTSSGGAANLAAGIPSDPPDVVGQAPIAPRA